MTKQIYDKVVNDVSARIRGRHGCCNTDMLISAVTDSYNAVVALGEPVSEAMGLWVVAAYRVYIDQIRKALSYPDQAVTDDAIFAVSPFDSEPIYCDISFWDDLEELSTVDKRLALAVITNDIGAVEGDVRYLRGYAKEWYMNNICNDKHAYERARHRIRNWLSRRTKEDA